MNINTFPPDIRKRVIFQWLPTPALLNGRLICKLWRTEIESLNELWKKIEGCTFDDFSSASRIRKNIRTGTHLNLSHMFKYSCDDRTFLLSGEQMIRHHTYYNTERRLYVSEMDVLNTLNEKVKTTKVIFPSSSSPNLRRIISEGLLNVPDDYFFKSTPFMMKLSGYPNLVCLYRWEMVAVWDLTTPRCIFFQPNVHRSLVFKGKKSVIYVNFLNQVQIWNPFEQKLLFSQQFEARIGSCSNRTEDVLLVNFKTNQSSFFDIQGNKLIANLNFHVKRYSVLIDHICCVDQDTYIHVISRKSGEDLFSPTWKGGCSDTKIALLATNALEIWDIATQNKCFDLPAPAITTISKMIYAEPINRCFILGRKQGLECVLHIYDLVQKQLINVWHHKTSMDKSEEMRLTQTALYLSCFIGEKRFLYIYNPKTGLLLKNLELKKTSMIVKDRIYEIDNSKMFKEFRFDATDEKLPLTTRIWNLISPSINLIQ